MLLFVLLVTILRVDFLTSGIRALFNLGFLDMSMKFDLPLLDYNTRFALWQVKMRAVLAHPDLDDALEKFGKAD